MERVDRPHPAATPCRPRSRRRPRGSPPDRCFRRSSTSWPISTPSTPSAVGLGGVRPSGGVHGAAVAAVVRSSGRASRTARLPALDALRGRPESRRCPSQARKQRRPRRLPARQHDPCIRRESDASSRCSTGRWSTLGRSALRPRRDARLLEPRRTTPEVLRRARIMAPVTADRRVPLRAPSRRAVRPSDWHRPLCDVDWYQSFAYFKLAIVCQGIAARAAGGSMVGGGFDQGGEGLSRRLIEAGRQQTRSSSSGRANRLITAACQPCNRDRGSLTPRARGGRWPSCGPHRARRGSSSTAPRRTARRAACPGTRRHRRGPGSRDR